MPFMANPPRRSLSSYNEKSSGGPPFPSSPSSPRLRPHTPRLTSCAPGMDPGTTSEHPKLLSSRGKILRARRAPRFHCSQAKLNRIEGDDGGRRRKRTVGRPRIDDVGRRVGEITRVYPWESNIGGIAVCSRARSSPHRDFARRIRRRQGGRGGEEEGVFYSLFTGFGLTAKDSDSDT